MFAKEVYISRRNALKSKVGSGILLFLGTGEAAVNYAGNAYRYRQDSTFNYYFGLTDPDLAAVIDLESGEEISRARRSSSATMSISTISSGWAPSRLSATRPLL